MVVLQEQAGSDQEAGASDQSAITLEVQVPDTFTVQSDQSLLSEYQALIGVALAFLIGIATIWVTSWAHRRDHELRVEARFRRKIAYLALLENDLEDVADRISLIFENIKIYENLGFRDPMWTSISNQMSQLIEGCNLNEDLGHLELLSRPTIASIRELNQHLGSITRSLPILIQWPVSFKGQNVLNFGRVEDAMDEGTQDDFDDFLDDFLETLQEAKQVCAELLLKVREDLGDY